MRGFLINLCFYFHFLWTREFGQVRFFSEIALLIKTFIFTRVKWIRFLWLLFKIYMPRLEIIRMRDFLDGYDKILLSWMLQFITYFTWLATHWWSGINNRAFLWKSESRLTTVVWTCLLIHYAWSDILILFRIRIMDKIN
jgi:hypothetical protein